MNKYIKTTKFIEETHNIKAIKINSFQRKLINMLSYASITQRERLSFKIYH